MKINKENMKGLAEKLDVAKPPTLEEVGITKDDICNMAYQLQYFFEAMEKIDRQRFGADGIENYEYRLGLKYALDKLNNALIDKEE